MLFMSNLSKAKGTRAEGEVARWLEGVTGYPIVRLALHGANDIGDLHGLPGVCVEVKAGQPHLGEWLKELDAEHVNAKTRWAVIVWRTPGTSNPHEWLVIKRPGAAGAHLPAPGPSTQLANYVRAVDTWAAPGRVSFVGFMLNGKTPTNRDTCDGVAMTGRAFELWLGNNLNPTAYEAPDLDELNR